MAKRRSVFIALALLTVVAASAIVCVIWLVLGRSRGSSGTGISAWAGGISWLEIYVLAGGALSISFALAAGVVWLMSNRERSERRAPSSERKERWPI